MLPPIPFISDPFGPLASHVLLQDFGTTATVCIYFKSQHVLIVSNCGDSSAMLGRGIERKNVIAVQGAAASQESQIQWEPIMLTINDNVEDISQKEIDRLKV